MKIPDSLGLRLAVVRIWDQWKPVILGGVALLVLLPGAWYLFSGAEERSANQLQESRQQAVQRLATVISQRLREQFGGVRATVPVAEFLRLFEHGDDVALERAAENLASRNPVVLRARLLRPGIEAVDYTTDPPLTYASLDLMRRSERDGRAPPPDAQLVGTDMAQIALLVRVEREDGSLVGHVLFSLDPGLVQAIVDNLALPGGYLEIQQPVIKSKPVVLARRGEPRPGQMLMHGLPGSGWTLRYLAPETGLMPEHGGGLWSLGWAFVGLVLILGVGVAGWQWRKRRVIPGTAKPADVGVTGQVAEEAGKPVVGAVLAESEPGSEIPIAAQDLPLGEAMEPESEDLAAGQVEGLSPVIFRAYDVRGLVGKNLSPDGAQLIGQAIGSEAYERGQQVVVVGRDGRESSHELAGALIDGLRTSGRDVIDVGRVPTPLLYFATHYLETQSGVMVTGSHNPPDYNGFKVMLGGEALAGKAISALYRRIQSQDLSIGDGALQMMEVDGEYIRRVSEDIPVALGSAYKLVVDAANGVAGELAPRLYRALGHDVVEMYCSVDGRFPNHPPDPSQPENLQALIARVKAEKADMGFAFDGDGDRLVVVDAGGNIVWGDRLLMLFAQDILPRNPGAGVIYDVKCSHRLAGFVEGLGGKPLMWKTGHSLLKQKIQESGALLAGEMSGHIFIKDRWYGFDDALYAGARLLETLRGLDGTPEQAFARLPAGLATPELRVDMAEGEAAALVARLTANTGFAQGAMVSTIDGVRADWPDGWGLVRASNTLPCLTMRFEGDDAAALERIQNLFKQAVNATAPGIKLPF